MSKIRDAVSIVMTCEDQIFAIQRQPFLKAFPGYWAFPGGKVEEGDEAYSLTHYLTQNLDPKLFGALVREGEEELGVDFRKEILNGNISCISFLGLAVTPDFNPYRFATYFFKIEFSKKVAFTIDENEARVAQWMSARELLDRFEDGQVLAVPPVITVIENLGRDPGIRSIEKLNFEYDSSQYVPYIEPLRSVRQIMPLSHTLPPAQRTNSFLIGDPHSPQILIDPSPKDETEYQKFKNTVALFGADQVLITHHHPDHHERATTYAREYGLPILLSADTHARLLKRDPHYFDGVTLKFIKEGDVVTKWLGRKVKVFEVPGHDEGQVAIAPEDMSWFLAGDLFQGVGTVVIGGEEGNMSKYFQTLERIMALSPKVLFPSHGIGLGGTSILERTLEHRKLREAQVLSMYQEGLKEEEMVAQIYASVPENLWPYALENVRKHLEKLREEGSI